MTDAIMKSFVLSWLKFWRLWIFSFFRLTGLLEEKMIYNYAGFGDVIQPDGT